ncbi:MAG: hypothetical protein M5U01_39300 [Ardenticatenaceae bacterium]|nr:hypothetical protein [Ardenticatenaceae bacterium]HBY92854.1 hypothetical protein [Chloroflexota bacterium]
MAKVGTMDTKPIRVDYSNGDYSRAYDLITGAGLKIIYKNVSSVEPYHVTIHLENIASRDAAAQLLDEAGINWYPATPFF